MIRVDRSRVPVPEVFRPGGRSERERGAAYEFFAAQKERQRRFDFTAYKVPEVKLALTELFHGKCAYCESRLMASAGLDIEMYRPKGGVAASSKHPGYWWLAFEWTNLLISCIDCNRSRVHMEVDQRAVSGKANRFPLADESKRAFGPEDDLSREEPLLLDPCVDEPDEHLVFDWSGLVASETPRGQTTIAVLGLNRVGLVEARARAARELRLSLDLLPALSGSDPNDSGRRQVLMRVLFELEAMTRQDAEYAGMKRQLLRPELGKSLGAGDVSGVFDWDTGGPSVSKLGRSRAKQAFHQFETEQSTFSLLDEKGRETSRALRRDIQRISIRNFKGIRSVDLDLTAGGSGGGWLMLLGENSTGKSSVLQSIALCLAGAEYLASLIKSQRIALKDLVNSRARKAIVTVRLSGFVDAHEMTVTSHEVTFKRPARKTAFVRVSGKGVPRVSGDQEARQVQFVLLGYGATRLLPRGNAVTYGQTYARIDNLFDAFLPLFDADAWLRDVDRAAFDEVALALKDLLSLDKDATLLREKAGVAVRTQWDKAPIKRLSDGFQAVVAMSIDILEVAIRLWGTPRNAEGIVLLDEIGAHLHPTWKMRIVASLRRAFPGMQFISTTHDPLCLRGLSQGEVIVMRRGEDKQVETVSGLPSPSDFRVDQLLTSEFFGLNSTVDPETEALFDRYYALLALRAPSAEEATELQKIQNDLKARRYVGDTLREQLMFEAVDRVIARHRAAGSLPMPVMRQEASDEIARLWGESVSAVLGPP